MDSVSQFALGAAVTAAVLGGRCPAGRAVLIGGLVATLPDLDVLIDHGDAVANMTMHRAESHALLWLAAATPLLAWLISRLRGQREHFGRWCLAVLLTLWTHVGLDALTIYGTQLALPFTDHPFGLGEDTRPGGPVDQGARLGERLSQHGPLILGIGTEKGRSEALDRLAVGDEHSRVDPVHRGPAHHSDHGLHRHRPEGVPKPARGAATPRTGGKK